MPSRVNLNRDYSVLERKTRNCIIFRSWLYCLVLSWCLILACFCWVLTQTTLVENTGLNTMYPVLMLWGGSHITCHIWRCVIVPSDLVLSFGAICVHYRYRVIHRTITNMLFESMLERQPALNKIIWRAYKCSYKKIRRYNNSPPYVTARWLPQQIPP